MRVLLFAKARDLAGAEMVDVSLPAGSTVAELRRALAEVCRPLAPLVERSAFAVNDEFVDDNAVIPPAAVVALLPPVSGG
jgi:molybdopterin synthase catalytic subunit/molybdopterin synthase sulfur carrier subunit